MATTEMPEMGFGDRLRKMRRQRGLTQLQLSSRCGVTDKTYRDWENGRREPSEVVVAGLAHLLDVPVAWLRSGREPDTDRYPLSAHPTLPLVDWWDQPELEQLEWTTRQSLTGTESGNAPVASRPRRSAATGKSTGRSSPGSELAA